jgi:hypothetical protein
MGKKYRSDALAAVHETALGLAEAGVMDKRTMKGFDDMCLTPVEELTAESGVLVEPAEPLRPQDGTSKIGGGG